MLRIITLNSAIQDVRICSWSVYRPVGFVLSRLIELSRQLIELDADIVCVQELFHPDYQQKFFTRLNNVYPYSTGLLKNTSRFRLGNELIILSKFPLKNGKLYRFKTAALEEKIFTSKGFYNVVADIPGLGDVRIINFHLTAGGIRRHPENNKMTTVRSGQIQQMLMNVPDDMPVIMAGDLNAGPETSIINYKEILQAGMVDAFTECGGKGITWDPENPLVKSGNERHLPPQRIDHVFLNRKAAELVEPINGHIVFNDLSVHLETGNKITISDHYGVQIEFKLC